MSNLGFGILSMFRLTRYLGFFYFIASILGFCMMICNYKAGGIILHKESISLQMVHTMLGNIGFSETRCSFHEPYSTDNKLASHPLTYECGQGVLSELKAFGLLPRNRTLLQNEGFDMNFCGKSSLSQAVSFCDQYIDEGQLIKEWNGLCKGEKSCHFDYISNLKLQNVDN